MKHINLTQMLQGCSKRNGMTVSASNPNGEPTVNRQSRLMSLSGKKAEKEQLSPSCLLSASFPLSFRSRYLRYAAMIFCVLAMSVGQAWGATQTVGYTTHIVTSSKTGTGRNIKQVTGLTVTALTSSDTYMPAYATGDKDMGNKIYGYNTCQSSKTSRYAMDCYNWKVGTQTGYAATNTFWTGFKVKVASGKKFSLSSANMRLLVNYNHTWRLAIEDSVSGARLATSSDYTITNYNACITNDSLVMSLSDTTACQDLTGTFYVKMYFAASASATGKYFCFPTLTVTGDLEDAAAGCAKYSFHYGTTKGSEDQMMCFSQVGSSTTYITEEWTIPSSDQWTYVGWQGGWHNDNAKSANLQLSGMRYGLDHSNTLGSISTNVMEGAKGYVQIYSDNNESNKYVGFVPSGYILRRGTDSDGWTSTAFIPDDADDVMEDEWTTPLTSFTADNADHFTYVGLKTASGYVWTNRSETRRPIFLKPNATWKNDNAKFVMYYWDDSSHGGYSAIMTDPDGDGVYEAWIPNTYSYNHVLFGRLNPVQVDPVVNWDNKWNKTTDQDLPSDKNLFEITGGSEQAFTGSWSVYGSKGKFHIWSSSNTNNWYCQYYPHYVLTYDANGGSGEPSAQSVPVDGTSSVRTVDVAAGSGMTPPTGYTFAGWNPDEDDADAGTIDGDYDPSDNVTLSADMTLYAVWSPKEYTITLDDESATTSVSPGTVTATYNSSTIASITNPEMTGYTFGGWYSGDDGTGTLIIDENGDLQANTAYTGAGGIWTNDDDVTLHAKWTAKTTAITLEAGDGGTDGSATATYGTSTITDYEAATRTGYTLGNYYRDGSKNNILTKEGELNSGDKGSILDDGLWVYDGATITLYAQWSVIEYTLSYNLAGGSVASDNPTSYTIESEDITLNNPTKTGYTFAGWTGTDLVSATTTVTIAAGSTGNRSYTATWTPIVPSSVSLKASTTITVGGTETLTATISPAVVADNTITWTSSDEDVATVDDGVVTAVAAGTATITATTVNGKTATCEVTVAPAVTYTVTYKANGGTGDDVVIDPATTIASNSFTAPATKAFVGWNTKDDGSGKDYAAGDAVDDNLTLYAQWQYKILYLTTASTEGDDLYNALKDDYVITVRAPKRAASFDYNDTIALIVLHESVKGDSAKSEVASREVYQLRTANVPVLNTKSYTYGSGRWAWGTPNPGKQPKCIYVKNDTYANLTSHPIFADLTPDGSDSIQILSSISSDNKPIQPVGSFTSGKEGYTLALVPNNESGSGAAIHELSATQRGTGASGQYLLISVYEKDLKNLNANGVKLFQNAVKYLIAGSAWVPQYAITKSATNGSIATEVSSSAVTSAAAGSRVDITATPTTGYDFSSWSVYKTGDAETTVSVNSTTTSPTYFTMPAYAVTVAATFVEGCTKPGTPTRPTIEDGTLTHAGATFVWDPVGATDHSNGYVVSIVKVSDGSTVLDWTSSGIYTEGEAGGLYDATGLTGSTEYYFIVKAIGDDGYCSYGDTSRLTFTTLGTPYTITYHLNGASWINEGAATYRHGTGYTLPVAGDMTNTGYTFGGWFADDDLETGGVKTEVGTSEYGDKEFWAKWTENTYTITYNANGDGAGNVGDATGSTSSTNGHYVTVADNGFALEDHVFAGWNTAANGSGDSYGEGDEIELTGNMTLYAIWATDYDISWGNAQYGGADETPDLGGGNYTITASVATWTGTLTTDMISAVSDGVMITNVAVDNSASPKTITATFDVGASVAGTTIKLQLDVPAYGVYGAKSSEKSITIDRCSGGVDASTVVFSQNFSSVGAGSVDYAANTAREYKSGGTTITGIVGSGTNEFTYIGQAQKDNCGVAVNSSTGGNSVNATGIFQAYCNNTGGKYALVKNSNFAATAPTALKVSMKIWFQQGSSGSDYSVTFAVGDGFSNSTSAPDATNVHSGFSILNNSNACLYPYKSNKTALSGTNKLTQGSDLTMVWVINNSGQTLSYTDPASNTSTLANDKFDVWVGTTRFIAGASATTASKTLQNLYIGDPAGKKHQLRLDDIVVTDISPAVSSITPTLTWDDGDLDIASVGVTKEEGDADFTFTASQNKNSLGAITYSSSNTSVATVNASGKVHIVGNGSTTITASIAESGCYKDADVSYSLTVNEEACADAAGTIKDNDGNTIDGNAITKSSCETVTLKLVGYTDGANIQWYKDGEAIDDATAASYTVPTSGSGVYSAISSKTCDRNSTNEITVTNSASVSATKIVDSWYVKAGRRTPDIALVQTTDAASFQVKISSTVIWSTVSGSEVTTGLGGCGFYLGKDGIIYLKGTKSNGNATDDILENKTLSFVVTNACGANASDPGNITIKRQAATGRPSVAYVSLGTKGGAVTDTTAGYYKTAALYKYLDHTLSDGDFDLTASNVYWSVNEKELKEHYSQFDAILITDDPSTKTVPSGVSGDGAYKTKGYVNALGCLVDIRPILTMEAYVSALANWKTKGINGDPTSPNPRQYSMKLQCKDHEIFGSLSVGDNVVQTTVDGTNYWSVKMVDNTKSPYSGLADDEKTSGKGSIPALQGFAASDVSGLLLLGQISDGAYHAGVERQEEPAARLMLLGLNNQALPNALTQEGKIVIKNALTYLLKTNMEEVDDCSNYFTGATSTDWNTPSNWFKGVVPNSPMVRARILAPCEITGITVKAAQIDIVTSGTSSKKAGELTGKLTINPTGSLIVGGKIRAAEAPYYSIEDLKPTEEEDLVLNTNSSNQAALIFDNEDGDTKATVNLYSLGRKSDGRYQFQYYAVPMDYVSVSESFAGSDIYTYVWHEATGWERRGYYTDLYAFEGVGITTKLADPKTYIMKGALASTATKEITLTKDDDGYNLIGNSWTAPIQISQLEEDNGSLSNKTVYIYNAGNDTTAADGYGTTAGQWTAIPFNAAGFELWSGLKVIPAMQAFELVPTSEETLTLDYEKVVRGDNQTLTEKLHAPRRVADHAGIELMRIRVADSQTRTDLHLFEGERFSDEFDNGWEAAYMDGDDGTTKLYADVALGHMAVVATDVLEGTLLGFAPGKETEYTFTFGGEGMGYYLNDLKLKTSTLISEEATYSFTYGDGDTNRFYISRTPIDAPQMPTGVENTHGDAVKARKFIYNDKLYIMLNGRVYSAEGQIVK